MPGDQFELVLIPPADPGPNRRRSTIGLTLARGEAVAIYDAEDEPEPLQLRRCRGGHAPLVRDVACVQAKLDYHNPMQNLITKWFTIDTPCGSRFFSLAWHRCMPRSRLVGRPTTSAGWPCRRLGAWDPFNVTEDADLGIRMFREGYSVRVLESSTFEEANSDFVNWMKQRSRWLKGYLQTFAVHLREPRELRRELGGKGSCTSPCSWVGTPILAIINPIFWLMTSCGSLPTRLSFRSCFPPHLLPGPHLVGIRQLSPRLCDRHELPLWPSGESSSFLRLPGPALLGDDVDGRGEGPQSARWRPELLGRRPFMGSIMSNVHPCRSCNDSKGAP